MLCWHVSGKISGEIRGISRIYLKFAAPRPLEISEALTLIRFQTKTELFCSVFKKICIHTYRFRIVFTYPPYNALSATPSVHMVKWTHRFQIASFSPSTLENSVFKKHRFQIAPLWRAFSNGSVFGDRFRHCSVDDSHIRSKAAPF